MNETWQRQPLIEFHHILCYLILLQCNVLCILYSFIVQCGNHQPHVVIECLKCGVSPCRDLYLASLQTPDCNYLPILHKPIFAREISCSLFVSGQHVYGCLHTTMAELYRKRQLKQRPYGPQSLKQLLSGPQQKKLANPWFALKKVIETM